MHVQGATGEAGGVLLERRVVIVTNMGRGVKMGKFVEYAAGGT